MSVLDTTPEETDQIEEDMLANVSDVTPEETD